MQPQAVPLPESHIAEYPVFGDDGGAGAPLGSVVPESSPRMLAPRPTKLRSQRDINLWRIPLQLSLAATALFGLTLIPDILDKYGVIRIPSWLTMGSIDDARAILSAMMGAVATVLALIFSVALLVLSMVSTLFGPRLLYRFLQDWVTQATIGVLMGTFVYICLVFLVTHQDQQSSFVPQISLLTGWVLVVLSFGFLVYYSHRVARSIQNPDMIGAIARRSVCRGRRRARVQSRRGEPALRQTTPRFCAGPRPV